MDTPMIKLNNVFYSYEEDGKNFPVLNGVSLEIQKGEFVAVIGHNGSGKSTFAKLLNMIIEPTSGEIFIDGKNISDKNMTDDDIFELRKKVGMVFQNPDNQLVATICEEDVAFGPENLGLPSEEIRKRVYDSLSVVGMQDYAKSEPARLSGGQKQRIAIAGILAIGPQCMIFDESTAMLDPSGRKEIMKTIEKLNKEKGITVVMITHYMEEATKASRIIVLEDGNIKMDATPKEIFSKPIELKLTGLDVPCSVNLAYALRKKGIQLTDDAYTIENCAEQILKEYYKNVKT